MYHRDIFLCKDDHRIERHYKVGYMLHSLLSKVHCDMTLNIDASRMEVAFHMVDRIVVIHDSKAHSSIQSYHINNGEKLRLGKEGKALHQDDSCDSRNEYDHKDWDEYMDEDILVSLFHNVQEALSAYDHNYKSLHQMLPLLIIKIV